MTDKRADSATRQVEPGTIASAPQPIARSPRPATVRDNLFAATMLLPVAAVGAFAIGKVVVRRIEPGTLLAALPFVEPAWAQTGGSTRGGSGAGATTAAAASAVMLAANTAPTPNGAAPIGGTPAVGTLAVGTLAGGTQVAATQSPGAAAAVVVLLDQAKFWQNQSQSDQALESLSRALALDPTNQEALGLSGLLEAERGDRGAAAAALARLRAIAPNDPRVAKIDEALRVGPITQEALNEARRLASEGHQAEAIARYDALFHGDAPPDRYAVEYYETLAGTAGGWEKARDGLAQAVRQNPQDLRAQFAYAQILTYREATRAEGITRLAALSRNGTVADQATQSWKQALGWLPDDKNALAPLTVYLQAHPNDPDIAGKLAASRNPTPDAADPGAQDRIAGFDALNKGKLADATGAFQKALGANADDADATGGLGIVRLRQHNFAEAKTLLAHAIALDPDHANRWREALDGATRGAAGAGGGGNLAAPAQRLLRAGDYAGAEHALQRAIATGRDRSGGLQIMLGDALVHQGRLGEAETAFRDALGRNPRNVGAIVGLAGVLSREGRSDEAQSLLAQAQALGGARQVGEAQALLLREQGQAVTDPATKVAIYREAVAYDPANPWIRLDLARALLRFGQIAEARSVMSGVVGSGASVDALRAATIFANETNDPDAAAALLARLPASARSPDLQVLQAQAAVQRQIAASTRLAPELARARLLALAGEPDPDGTRGAAIARALYRRGDAVLARDALLAARAATRPNTATQLLAYAGAALDIGDGPGAQQLLAEVNPGALQSADQRNGYAQLLAGLTIRSSDQLNDQGKQADAYDRLAPVLAQAPDNPNLNLALARLYQGAREPREAMAINEAVLRRDPANLDARRGAIGAALQLGDRGRADALVQDGLKLAPNDPKLWMASAEVAKSRGNAGRALRDLQRARELRLQQLGYSDNGDDTSTLPAVSLTPGGPVRTDRVARRPRYTPPPAAFAMIGGSTVLGSGGPGSRAVGNADGGDDGSTLPPPRAPSPPAAPGPYPRSPFSPPAVGRPIVARDDRAVVALSNDAPYHKLLDTAADALPPPAPAGGTPASVAADANDGWPLSRPPGLTPRATPASTVPAAQISAGAPAYAPIYTPTPEQADPGLQAAPSPAAPSPAAPPPAAPPSAAPVPSATMPQDAVASAPLPPPTRTIPSSSASISAVPIPPAGGVPPPIVLAQAYQAPAYAPPAYAPPAYPPPPYPLPGNAAPAYSAPAYPSPTYPSPTYPSPDTPVSPYGAPPPRPPTYQPIYRPTYPQSGFGDAAYAGPTLPPQYRYQPQQAAPVPSYAPSAAASPYANPFRSATSAAPGSLQTAATPAPSDPVTQEIDRNIAALQDEVAPSLQIGGGYRQRSGDQGLDKLKEYTVPLEAQFSPGGVGRLTVTATPDVLDAGTLGTTPGDLARFGTSALALSNQNFKVVYNGPAIPHQQATGTGLDVAYQYSDFKGDIGSTPLGFDVTNVIGGLESTFRLTPYMRLILSFNRRQVTDSLLADAGTRDTRTGRIWGGDIKTSGHANLAFDFGKGYAYAGGGYGQITGTHVATNNTWEAGAGGAYPVYKDDINEVRVGVDLVYFGYQKNLDFFTLGQGGYFSPQSYAAGFLPITYLGKFNDNLSVEVSGAAGYQTYREKSSPVYPEDPQLQSQLVAEANNTTAPVYGLQSTYPAQHKTGFAGNAYAKVDYRVTPNLRIGGRVGVLSSGNFTEVNGTVYAKYLFNTPTGQ